MAAKRRSPNEILGTKAKKKKKKVGEPRYPALGDLQTLLLKAFPDAVTPDYEVLDVAWLARKLKISKQAFYFYMQKGSMPYSRAKQLVAIKGCKRKIADFDPFIA